MRRLFYAARIIPASRPVCPQGEHVGRLVGTKKYEAVEGWENMGECSYCMSTIHESQLLSSRSAA